ncbi:serine-rich adhesin for platelets isoform X5 [Cherax quadricarinatus]
MDVISERIENDPSACQPTGGQLPSTATVTPHKFIQHNICDRKFVLSTLLPAASSTPSVNYQNRSRAINPLLNETFSFQDPDGNLVTRSPVPLISSPLEKETPECSRIMKKTLPIHSECGKNISNPDLTSACHASNIVNNEIVFKDFSNRASCSKDDLVSRVETAEFSRPESTEALNTTVDESSMDAPHAVQDSMNSTFIVDKTQRVKIGESFLHDVSEFCVFEDAIPEKPSVDAQETGKRDNSSLADDSALEGHSLDHSEGDLSRAKITEFSRQERTKTLNATMHESRMPARAIKNSMNSTFTVETTQLVNISESYLHDDLELSVSEDMPEKPAFDALETWKFDHSSFEDYSLDHDSVVDDSLPGFTPIEYSDVRNCYDDSNGLLEDISDSILNYSGTSSLSNENTEEMPVGDCIPDPDDDDYDTKYNFGMNEGRGLYRHGQDREDFAFAQCDTCCNQFCYCSKNKVPSTDGPGIKFATVNTGPDTTPFIQGDVLHVTLIEDINDSILNYTTRTVSEIDDAEQTRVTHADCKGYENGNVFHDASATDSYVYENKQPYYKEIDSEVEVIDYRVDGGSDFDYTRSCDPVVSPDYSSNLFEDTGGSCLNHDQKNAANFPELDSDSKPELWSDDSGGMENKSPNVETAKSVSIISQKTEQRILASREGTSQLGSAVEQGTTEHASITVGQETNESVIYVNQGTADHASITVGQETKESVIYVDQGTTDHASVTVGQETNESVIYVEQGTTDHASVTVGQETNESVIYVEQGTREHASITVSQETNESVIYVDQGTTEHANITVSQETEHPVVTIDPETEHPAVTVDPETQYPAVTVDPETQHPVVTVDPETEHPVVTVDPETEHPVVTVDPETEHPVVTVDPETEHPVVTVDPETDHAAVTVDPETEHPVVTVDPETDHAAVTVDPETEHPVVTVDQETDLRAATVDESQDSFVEESDQDSSTDQESDQNSSIDQESNQNGSIDHRLDQNHSVDQQSIETKAAKHEIVTRLSRTANSHVLDYHMLISKTGEDETTTTITQGEQVNSENEMHDPRTSVNLRIDVPSATALTSLDVDSSVASAVQGMVLVTAAVCLETDQLPADSQGTNQPPTDSQGTNQPPTDSQGTNQPPTDSQGTNQPPTDSQGTNQPPTDSQGTNQPPTDSQGTIQPSTDNQGTNQPSTDSQGTNQPPTDSQGTIQPPTDSQGTNQPPTDSQGTNQPSTDSQGTNQPPTDSQGTNQPPTDSQGTNQPPADSQGTIQPPTDSQGTIQPPTDSQGTDQPPATLETDSPPPAGHGTDQPPPASQGTHPPLLASQGTDQPSPASQESDQPSPASQEADQPSPASQRTDQPPPPSHGTNQPPPPSYGTNRPPPASSVTGQPPSASQKLSHLSTTSSQETGETSSANSLGKDLSTVGVMASLSETALKVGTPPPECSLQHDFEVPGVASCVSVILKHETRSTSKKVVQGDLSVAPMLGDVFNEEVRGLEEVVKLGSTESSSLCTFTRLVPVPCEADGLSEPIGLESKTNATTEPTGDTADLELCKSTPGTPALYTSDSSFENILESKRQVVMEGSDVILDLDAYDACPSREANTSDTVLYITPTEVCVKDEDQVNPSVGEEVYEGVGESDTSIQSVASRRAEVAPGMPNTVAASPASSLLQQSTAEEDFVDGVFRECDTDGVGYVSASNIAARLVLVLSDLQPRWLVDSLRDALCMEGDEKQLDIKTYREVLISWHHNCETHFNMPCSNTSAHACEESSSIPPEVGSNSLNIMDMLSPLRHSPGSSQASFTLYPGTTPILPQGSESLMEDEFFAWCGYHDNTECKPRTTPPKPKFLTDNCKRSLQRDFDASNRRSTLLPWGRSPSRGGNGDGIVGTRSKRLGMSRSPSPVPPASTPSVIADKTDINTFDHATCRGESDKMNHMGRLSEQSALNFTYGSIEDEGGVTKPDPGELEQEVLELEHTNRRLTGEKAELTTILTHAEDANVSLREQCRYLEHTLSNVQQQLVSARKLETEMEEVRVQLDSEREEKERLQSTLAQLEKDNLALSLRLEALIQQLNSAHEDVENQTLVERELVRSHKSEVAMLVAELAKWKHEAETQALASHHLEETVKDLRKLTEVLREERASLEDQLSDVREELASVKAQAEVEVSGVDIVEESSPNVCKVEEGVTVPLSAATWGPLSLSAPVDTPSLLGPTREATLSIHSEIQTMGEESGSLPFCEKIEDNVMTASKSQSEEMITQLPVSDVALSTQTSLVLKMLKLWQDWEEEGVPLLKSMIKEDTSALHAHFKSHRNELIKLGKQLQEITRKTAVETPSPYRKSPLSHSFKRGPLSTSQDARVPSLQSATPRSRIQRTPGSIVSQLISKFEHSSQSASPVNSELSERLSLTYSGSNLSKIVQRFQDRRDSLSSFSEYDAGRRNSYDGGCSSVSSDVGKTSNSPTSNSPITFKTMNKHGSHKDNHFGLDLGSEETSDECYFSKKLICAKDSENELNCTSQEYDINDSSIEQDREFSYIDTRNSIEKKSMDCMYDNLNTEKQKIDGAILDFGFDEDLNADGNERNKDQNHRGTERLEDAVKNNENKVGEVDLEFEEDVYMETSHLMKLMNEVAEQRIIITQLKEQLMRTEEEKESFTALLARLHRLILHVSTQTFKWTEGVRKEWLSVVPSGEEEEGATDPLRTPGTLDDVPLTGTHSREEIESLIRTRCDLGCQHSDNFNKEYINPENLAAELEKELLALKLHVARSHALLHHYQSSSLYGSRSEVSTPPVAGAQHVQGVEAGVECDLCGPTCAPRPSGSTATQTPASPAPATPESEDTVACAPATVWEADDGVCVREELLHQDSPHLRLPQHRDLRQWVEVTEEVEEEEDSLQEVVASDMASDHTLYAPKPAYDQLDQYRGGNRRAGDEKHRRTGLTTVSPQVGGSSESEESEQELKTRTTRRQRPHITHLQQPSQAELDVAPLSPPPSLENAEEEDSPIKEEPHLPSTPESGSSITSSELFSRLTQRAALTSVTSSDDTCGASSAARTTSVSCILTEVPAHGDTQDNPTTSTSSTQQPSNPTTSADEEGSVGGGERCQSCCTVFPSLQDNHLRAAGLLRDDSIPNENLSAQEIESKFTQLSLAFKTDRLTLRQRLDVQQRLRDTAETNFSTEVNHLISSILALQSECMDSDIIDAVMQVRRHLDILATSSNRLVSASEVWGAVQQEWRVSRALEVLLLHVENVKRMYERDHQELEELRRILNEYQIELPTSQGASGGNNQSAVDSPAATRRLRALSLAGYSNKTQDSRRISFTNSSIKTPATAFMGSRASRRRASLMPDLKPFQELAAVAAAAAAAAAAASSSSSSSPTSKDKTEESEKPSNGVWANSITEEGSESGEEGNETSQSTNKNSTSNSSIANTLAQLHPELYAAAAAAASLPQDCNRRFSEESNISSASESTSADAPISNTPPIPNLGPQHWLLEALEDVIGWVRGGQWPYSQQQTVQGARYAFTSLLLLLAAFFLLLTISTGDLKVPYPYHPGWTTIHHVLHPFVSLRYVGTPPT